MIMSELPAVKYGKTYFVLCIDRGDHTISLIEVNTEERAMTISQFEEANYHTTVVTSGKQLTLMRITDPTLTIYSYDGFGGYDETLEKLLKLHNC